MYLLGNPVDNPLANQQDFRQGSLVGSPAERHRDNLLVSQAVNLLDNQQPHRVILQVDHQGSQRVVRADSLVDNLVYSLVDSLVGDLVGNQV